MLPVVKTIVIETKALAVATQVAGGGFASCEAKDNSHCDEETSTRIS